MDMTRAEFLTARLDEDEAAARQASHTAPAGPDPTYVTVFDPLMKLQQRMDPPRVLREVKAKRRIVERCAAVDYAMPPTHLAHGILSEMAVVYADHPDYREEWRP